MMLRGFSKWYFVWCFWMLPACSIYQITLHSYKSTIKIWYRCYLWNPFFVRLIRWSSLKKPSLKSMDPFPFESCMVLQPHRSSWYPKVLKGRYLEKNATRLILESDLGSWDLQISTASKKNAFKKRGEAVNPKGQGVPWRFWRFLRLMILKPM